MVVCCRPAFASDKITVFAAASLKNALDAANVAWDKKTGVSVVSSYAASGPLAKQIEAGAPADVFISADLDWMDYLAQKNLLQNATRSNLLGNELVLIAPKSTSKPVKIDKTLDLDGLLAGGRLAIGEPKSVPAGKYAQAALQSLGLWEKIRDRTANAESVRAALALVSRGEAPYGIVYRTDSAADPGVAIVGTFPEGSYPPIVYPIALLADSKNEKAKAYVDFLKSAEARQFFTAQGFTILE
ncbi:molybdate ABC transporter substrate-binding protein [Oryzifoliimicrobium ureilyticus]|uniref:molybdate ABC transporter substrate-binding protein n=1 Tax=Oryzifoliimicrobium ureilyticus TaxID=3113724 RepID=UPI003075F532